MLKKEINEEKQSILSGILKNKQSSQRNSIINVTRFRRYVTGKSNKSSSSLNPDTNFYFIIRLIQIYPKRSVKKRKGMEMRHSENLSHTNHLRQTSWIKGKLCLHSFYSFDLIDYFKRLGFILFETGPELRNQRNGYTKFIIKVTTSNK